MADVFLSYKRDDEERASKLVGALQAEGFSVWWDASLPGGEDWRANIERALEEAKCVVVLWTWNSIDHDAGRFVRDEASRAYQRGVLVPVLIERVSPPLGFGEVQAIDLVHWRGARSDPFFKDLVNAVRAKAAGRSAPPAQGPVTRLRRRLRAAAGVSALAAAVIGFAMNGLGAQDQFCALPLGQPSLSDACGALGLGHRPSYSERVSWESRELHSCDALREFANQQGHFQTVADAMLEARIEERSRDFTPRPRQVRNYLRTAEQPSATEAAARADALTRAEIDAREVTCAPREYERLASATLVSSASDCRRDLRGGYNCSMDYVAHCNIEERRLVERCE